MNIPDEFLPQVEDIYNKIMSDYRQIKKHSFQITEMTRDLTNKGLALNTSLGLSKQDKHLVFFLRKNPTGDEIFEYFWNKVKPNKE